MLRWLKTVVVSDEEKASWEASGGDQEGERKRIADEVSKEIQMTSKPGLGCAPGRAWRVPADWPGGVRHGGDASLICCFCMEREKARPDTAVLVRDGERETPGRRKPLGIEYRRGARRRTCS
jgi:hypothetical protein